MRERERERDRGIGGHVGLLYITSVWPLTFIDRLYTQWAHAQVADNTRDVMRARGRWLTSCLCLGGRAGGGTGSSTESELL